MDKTCIDCEFHTVVPDPDPNDWFCGDDVAVICTMTRNPSKNINSKYLSNRMEHRSVTCSCRPHRIEKESNIPQWCPLNE